LNGQHVGEFAPWLQDDKLPGTALHGGAAPLGYIDKISELLCDARMTETRLVSRRLHRDRQKLLVVAFQMALEQAIM
jgi:hypothetical protein